jgi:pimeloyl-ACP methyl ester carboxylesterase
LKPLVLLSPLLLMWPADMPPALRPKPLCPAPPLPPAYDSAEALRAANSWFSSFATDIADAGGYAPLTIPVLGLGGISYDFLAAFLGTAAPDATVLKLPNTGHWIPDEPPDETVRYLPSQRCCQSYTGYG